MRYHLDPIPFKTSLVLLFTIFFSKNNVSYQSDESVIAFNNQQTVEHFKNLALKICGVCWQWWLGAGHVPQQWPWQTLQEWKSTCGAEEVTFGNLGRISIKEFAGMLSADRRWPPTEFSHNSSQHASSGVLPPLEFQPLSAPPSPRKDANTLFSGVFSLVVCSIELQESISQ